MMIKVGLTGGIGSGKSTVARLLHQIAGVAVYDCDLRAKFLMENSQAVVEGVKSLFSERAYLWSDGRWVLNRAYLADCIFNDSQLRHRLESVVHPAVELDFEQWVSQQSGSYVLKESAILFESGADKGLDAVVVVDATIEQRMQRVVLRDGVTSEQVLGRINSQMGSGERIAKADFVITTDDSEHLIPRIIELNRVLGEIKNP